MRRERLSPWGHLAVALVLAACTDGPPERTTSHSARVETNIGSAESEHWDWALGALPDGTPYEIWGPPSTGPLVRSVHAVIMHDGPDHAVPLAAMSAVRNEQTNSEPRSDTAVIVPTSTWTIRLELLSESPSQLDHRYMQTLRSSVTERNGFPVIRLHDPLRFAEDYEVPVSMEVAYDTFVVRRGCDRNVAWGRCSPDQAVQVVALAGLVAPAPPTPPPSLLIRSPD